MRKTGIYLASGAAIALAAPLLIWLLSPDYRSDRLAISASLSRTIQIILTGAATLLLIAGIILVARLAITTYQRLRYLQPDERGLIPFGDDRYDPTAQAALAAHHAAQLAAARPTQPVPKHFAPHIHVAASSQHKLALPDPEQIHAPQPPPHVPTFTELLDAGDIGRRRPLLLGYGENGPLTGDWRALYSAGLGGLQGSGKTSTAAYLLAQSVLNGARLLICDPHAGDNESLATRIAPLAPAYLAEPATDERSILAALQLASDELERRKSGGERWPLIIAIDEWTALLRHDLRDRLPDLVASFATEGRKFGIHCLLMAQRWSIASAGGGDVRNTLTAHYLHRSRRDEARMQLGLGSATPADTISLQPGQAYLLDTRGNLERVFIPRTTPADLARVAHLLTDDAPTMPRVTATRRQNDYAVADLDEPISHRVVNNQSIVSHSEAPDYSASQRQISSPEHTRIIDLFLDGMDAGRIVSEISGMSSKSGKPYLQKLAEVQAIIREELRTFRE